MLRKTLQKASYALPNSASVCAVAHGATSLMIPGVKASACVIGVCMLL